MADATGFRLSPVQRRLWYLAALDPAFRVQYALAIPEAVDDERLRERLSSAVAREAILRTRFNRIEGLTTPIQIVDDEGSFSWAEIDVEEASPDTDLLLLRERQTPIDCERGPVVRAVLARGKRNARVLVLSIPSLCGDLATLSMVVSDVAGLARDPGLPYPQFAEWQNESAEAAGRFDAVARWASLRPAAPEAVRLAIERRPAAGGFAPRFRAHPLPMRVVQRLHEFARSLQVAPESILLTCWHQLLRTLTHCDDLVVGVRAAGRDQPMLAGLCGPVARFIPQRLATGNERAFQEMVREVDADLVEQRQHGIYFTSPDTEIVPFLFASEPWAQELGDTGERFTVLARYACGEPFSIQLTCVDRGDSVAIEWGFDTSRFSDDSADYLCDLYAVLLAQAVEHRGRAAGRLDLLSPRARQAVLDVSVGASRPVPETSLIALFERQAAATPHRDAVVDARQTLTYAALDATANAVGHSLQRLGAGPDVLVGLLTDRSVDTLAGLLGILKAGAAVVPLDPAQPVERWRATRVGAGICALVGRAALLTDHGSLPTIPITVNLSAGDSEVDAPAISSSTLAYAIFTSGSSGLPKAVAIEQRAVVNLLDSLRRFVYHDLANPLRVAVNAPLTFDASVKQWMQLLHGHTLYLVPEDVRLDPAATLEWIDSNAVEVVDCTPAQLQMLLDRGLSHSTVPTLKAVLIGGEPIDPSLWAWLRRTTDVRFYNVYGPTECTVDATGCDIHTSGEIPVIGRPLDNVETYILDERLEPAPIGVDGEIFIGGAGVARGYLHMPALTAERFLPDPFATRPGSRLYRTGDRARWLIDGAIEYRGRTDRQIKIRGYRVEPGEVEAALLNEPAICAAAVAPVAASDGRLRLTAYVVAANGSLPDETRLRTSLRRILPEFMLPDRIARVDRLPLTANAKVDYRALSESAQALQRRRVAIAPRNELERTIAEVWREVLQVEDAISVDDNFFDVGGHSLLLLQLHGRLRDTLDRDFAVVDLFRRPTVSSFAAFLAEGVGPAWSRAAVAARADRQIQASRKHQGWRSKDE